MKILMNKLKILCLAVLCSIFANRSVATKKLTKIGAERSKDQSSNFDNSLLYFSPLILWPLNEFAVYKGFYGGWLEYFSVVGQHRLNVARQKKAERLKECNEAKAEYYNHIRGVFKELRENMLEDNSQKLIDLLAVLQEKEYFEKVSKYLNDPDMNTCCNIDPIQINSDLFCRRIAKFRRYSVREPRLLRFTLFFIYPVKFEGVKYLGLCAMPATVNHYFNCVEFIRGHLPGSPALLERHNKFNETLTLNQDGTLNDSMLLKDKKDASKSAEFVELGYWDLSHVEAVAKGEKNLSYLFDYIL